MEAAEFAVHKEVETLYSSHHGWLQGRLRRALGNSADAADLAHDVFARLLARRQPIRAAEPRAFLSTMARRMVIDHWRRRELEKAWLDTLAAMPGPQTPSVESQQIILETLAAIDKILDAFPPAVRSAFLWNQLEGLSCPEIAKRLDISLTTAERYVAKVLRACYALRFE
ncbi:sigma-70 family RNA polymerase sigma factor [Bordetella sp. BOR01]|uniref:sigma-70 family RNA polymerase sigma factor n=1 Tax=Bordetella sp. BOR01 TaxID=2854779 RepID=UPI001C492336|nr:sigma-70 family RNA polymerase sigma factor [Bordetella sp. BOR01]MBV7481613.1 sigma-70 family RNA polymerase sigma factor [Bordetella sp. BOR01]